ncbi:MAG: hypothetical protein AAGN35_08195 [Bacteroidota bacterium]
MQRFRNLFFRAILLAVILGGPGWVLGQGFFEFPPASPFNRRAVQPPDSAWSYTFLAGGHLYGAHENERSIYPAASLLANFKRMSASPATFLVALGDIMRNSGDSAMIRATATAFAGLEMPVFNAPGNHDLRDRAAYEKAFATGGANAFFKFPGSANQVGFFIQDDYFVILDTEYLLEEGESSNLFGFIDRESKRLEKRARRPRHVFVFSHRLLWALCESALGPADALANEPIAGIVAQETACKAVKAVTGLPHSGEVYWISGDVGTHWSVPLLYGYDAANQLHVIANGIGDTPEDVLLKVTVSPEGKVALGTYPLSDRKWKAVESYTLDYWQAQPKSSAAGEGFWAKVIAATSGEVFWLALIAGMVLALGASRLFRVFGRR